MDLSSQKSVSVISLGFFLMLGYHFFAGNNDSPVLRWAAISAMLVLYILLVFARWKRDRTTTAWVIPLTLSVFGLVAAFTIIVTAH